MMHRLPATGQNSGRRARKQSPYVLHRRHHRQTITYVCPGGRRNAARRRAGFSHTFPHGVCCMCVCVCFCVYVCGRMVGDHIRNDRPGPFGTTSRSVGSLLARHVSTRAHTHGHNFSLRSFSCGPRPGPQWRTSLLPCHSASVYLSVYLLCVCVPCALRQHSALPCSLSLSLSLSVFCCFRLCSV
jgi:hypothetical protein